jgi:hypothetical protein
VSEIGTIDVARKERLAKELKEAVDELDRLTRVNEPGLMRTQQAVEGQRAKVYSIRSELLQIELERIKAGKDSERRKELRDEWTGLQLRIKEANQAARAASSQAADDEIGEMLRRLNQADQFAGQVARLH